MKVGLVTLKSVAGKGKTQRSPKRLPIPLKYIAGKSRRYHSTVLLRTEGLVWGYGSDVIKPGEMADGFFEKRRREVYRQEGKGRKTDKEMEEMLSKMIKPSTVNDEDFKGLKIINFAKTEPTGYRGQALDQKITELLALKRAGITTIIDPYGLERYQEICEKNGLKYVQYISTSSSESKENLIRFIEAINDGHYYISCPYGTIHTDIALGVSRVLNPKNKQYEEAILMNDFSKSLQIEDKDLYKSAIRRSNYLTGTFSESDKQRLGWTPEFEKSIPERIKAELARIGL